MDLSQAASSAIVDSIVRVEKATYPGGGGPELYHLPTDPGQRTNLYAERRREAERLHAEHVRMLEALGTSEEHLANRRELTDHP